MRQMRVLIFAGLVLGASVITPSLAQEPLTTNRSTELRSAPDDSATVIKQLADKAPLQLQERKGAWSRVKSGSDMGWVRMMHLRGGATLVSDQQQATGGGWLSSMNRLLGGGSSSTNQRAQSATVGIRGITEQDLRDAEPNPVALAKMKGYAAAEGDARQLATQGNLAFRNVAYLANDAILAAESKGGKK